MVNTSGVNVKDLPEEAKKRLREQGIKLYLKEDVLKTAGAVVVTLGTSGLPIQGQKEALALVQGWIRNMRG